MIFVDSSAWLAAINRRDRHHPRATELLASHAPLVTSDLVIVETWLLTNSRIDFPTAEHFFRSADTPIRPGPCAGIRGSTLKPPSAPLPVPKFWRALLDKGRHAFFLVVGGKQRVEDAPFESNAFRERRL